jgi:hypothetical protein
MVLGPALAAAALAGPSATSLEPASMHPEPAREMALNGSDFTEGVKVEIAVLGTKGVAAITVAPTGLAATRLHFLGPAWLTPGTHDVAVLWPDGTRACVPGGLVVANTMCTVPAITFPLGSAALDAQAEADIRQGVDCLVTRGVVEITALGRAVPGEGLTWLSWAAGAGRVSPNLELSRARAEAVAKVAREAVPARASVSVSSLALLDAPDEGQGEIQVPRVDVVGTWPMGVGPLPCPRDASADALACLVDHGAEMVVVESPLTLAPAEAPRVRAEAGAAWAAMKETAHTYAESGLDVGMGNPGARRVARRVLAVPNRTTTAPPGRYALEGCPALPQGWDLAYGEEPGGLSWMVSASAGPVAGSDLGESWSTQVEFDLRLGADQGPFVGLSESARPWTEPYWPSLKVGAQALLAGDRRAWAWVGLHDLGRTLGLGADATLLVGSRVPVALVLGVDGGVGLSLDAPWRGGANLRLGYQGQLRRREHEPEW